MEEYEKKGECGMAYEMMEFIFDTVKMPSGMRGSKYSFLISLLILPVALLWVVSMTILLSPAIFIALLWEMINENN